MKKRKFLLVLTVFAAICLFGALFCACTKDDVPPENPDYGITEIDTNVTKITLETGNVKKVFDLNGEQFDFAGLGIILHYADGTTKVAPAVKEFVSAPDMTTRGAKTVMVKYGELTAEYNILLRELETLEIDSSAVQKEFEINSDFSASGLKVYAKYFDIEEKETIPESRYTVDCNISTRGDKRAVVKYLGKTVDYAVRVKSKPVALESVKVVSEGGEVYLKATGKVLPEAGYTAGELMLDVQPYNSSDGITLTRADSFVNGDGAFEIKSLIAKDSLTAGTPYLAHIFLGGDRYDLASLSSAADNIVEAGGKYYRAKSEKLFDNNETLFLTLRVAGDFNSLASYSVDKVEVKNVDGVAHLVLTGKIGDYTPEQIASLAFHFDAETNPYAATGSSAAGVRKLERDNIALERSENGTFTFEIDISSLDKYKYTLHFCAGTPTGDSGNILCGGNSSAVTVNGVSYKVVFGDSKYFGSVGLEIAGNPEEVIGIRLDTSKVKTTFEFGVDTFNYDNLKVYKVMGDGKETELERGDGGYILTAPDVSTPGTKKVIVEFGGFTESYNVMFSCKPQINGVTLKTDGGKLYLQISGLITGYENPQITADLQKLNSDDYIRNLVCTPVVDAEHGSFTASVEIGGLNLENSTQSGNVGYMIHVLINGDSYDVVDISTEANSSTSYNGKYFRLKSECCFADNTSKFVILRAGQTESEVTPKVFFTHTAALSVEGENLYLVVTGYSDGYTAFEGIELQLRNKQLAIFTLSTEVSIQGNSFVLKGLIPKDETILPVGEDNQVFARIKFPNVVEDELYNTDRNFNLPGGVKTETVNAPYGEYKIESKSLFDQKLLTVITLVSKSNG